MNLEKMILEELDSIPKSNSEELRTYVLNMAMTSRLLLITERYESSEATIFSILEDLMDSDMMKSPASYLQVIRASDEMVRHANRVVTNILFTD